MFLLTSSNFIICYFFLSSRSSYFSLISFFFFFNDTATTEIYTLSLHDALPISSPQKARVWKPPRSWSSRIACCWLPTRSASTSSPAQIKPCGCPDGSLRLCNAGPWLAMAQTNKRIQAPLSYAVIVLFAPLHLRCHSS